MTKKIKSKAKAKSPAKPVQSSVERRGVLKSRQVSSKAPHAKRGGKEKDDLGIGRTEVPKQQAKHLPVAFIKSQKIKLLELRDHILDQMQCVAQDSLRARPEGSEASAFGMHQADAGSDAYDKDFALSLLSQEQDALYEVEEGLKRVENGTYGICEMSSKPIPKNRLEAIPFARFTVECQTQMERENRGRHRWDTAPQFMDSEESLVEEEEESGDDEERRKEKE